MKFETLKDKCEYYRGLSDIKLIPNMPVLVMLDGHCFSKIIKTRYELPFDDKFINLMNETAAHVCSKIQGAVFAYTQSDEISILIKDYINPDSDAFFGYRTCKLLSLIAAEATAFFNRKLFETILKDSPTIESAKSFLSCEPLATFDCKVWNVPNDNEVFAWFLYRQNDCVRNSMQQFAQTYVSHKELLNKSAGDQIEIAKAKVGKDWHVIDDGKKYGRLIYKEIQPHTIEVKGKTIEYERNTFVAHNADNFNVSPEILRNLICKQ